MTPNVFGKLTKSGYFYDPVLKEVENVFAPWLVQVSNTIIARLKTFFEGNGEPIGQYSTIQEDSGRYYSIYFGKICRNSQGTIEKGRGRKS
jgi:hypothetical protein